MEFNKAEKYLCSKSYLFSEVYLKVDRKYYKIRGRSSAFRKIAKAIKKKWRNSQFELMMFFEKDDAEITGMLQNI